MTITNKRTEKVQQMEDRINLLFEKLHSLLEVGLRCDHNSCSRKHWHNYLYIISDLTNQLETEISGYQNEIS
jgi:hypothetical protein